MIEKVLTSYQYQSDFRFLLLFLYFLLLIFLIIHHLKLIITFKQQSHPQTASNQQQIFMLSCLSDKKIFSLGVGMFGVVSVYLVYNVIYERAIYQHFVNSSNGEKEIFQSEVGFVFVEQFLVWILVEAIMLMSLKKEAENVVPRQYSLLCGAFCTLSSILYTYGTFQISYISCIIHKTLSFSFVNFVVFLIGKIFIQHRLSKRVDLLLSKVMMLGNLLFWIYADQHWFFSENKNGHAYAHCIVVSALLDAFQAMMQTAVCEKYQPSDVQLLHVVSRWSVGCSFVVLTIQGDFIYTIKFFFTHYDFAVTMISLAGLYFVGQFFLYRITTRMNVNVPVFIASSKNTLVAHQSYALSRHKLNGNQLIGMVVSWLAIAGQFLLFARKDENDQVDKLGSIEDDPIMDELQLRKLNTKRKR